MREVNDRNAIEKGELEHDPQIPEEGLAPILPEYSTVVQEQVKRPAHDIGGE
jgi:hypothetical protein